MEKDDDQPSSPRDIMNPTPTFTDHMQPSKQAEGSSPSFVTILRK